MRIETSYIKREKNIQNGASMFYFHYQSNGPIEYIQLHTFENVFFHRSFIPGLSPWDLGTIDSLVWRVNQLLMAFEDSSKCVSNIT